jgi:hypothetical protein
MAQRKTPSLMYAEYVSPDPDSNGQVWQARLELFDTVRRVHAKFLEKLSAEALPFYRRLAQDGHNFRLWGPKSPYNALPQGSDLKSGLTRWATEFNVNVGWLMDDALRTLRLWSLNSEEHESLAWNTHRPHRVLVVMGDQFTLTCEGWETTLLEWSAYCKSVRRRFEQKLLNYENETRELAKSQGLLPAQRKYSPKNLEWFVLYQFAGMSSKEISDRYALRGNEVDDSTVLKGIKAAAKLIGWNDLRKPINKETRKIR